MQFLNEQNPIRINICFSRRAPGLVSAVMDYDIYMFMLTGQIDLQQKVVILSISNKFL